jgi:hypothetical protein
MASAVALDCNGAQGLGQPESDIFWHLKVNLNNYNCSIFCIIYAINNANISAFEGLGGTHFKARRNQHWI